MSGEHQPERDQHPGYGRDDLLQSWVCKRSEAASLRFLIHSPRTSAADRIRLFPSGEKSQEK